MGEQVPQSADPGTVIWCPWVHVVMTMMSPPPPADALSLWEFARKASCRRYKWNDCPTSVFPSYKPVVLVLGNGSKGIWFGRCPSVSPTKCKFPNINQDSRLICKAQDKTLKSYDHSVSCCWQGTPPEASVAILQVGRGLGGTGGG